VAPIAEGIRAWATAETSLVHEFVHEACCTGPSTGGYTPNWALEGVAPPPVVGADARVPGAGDDATVVAMASGTDQPFGADVRSGGASASCVPSGDAAVSLAAIVGVVVGVCVVSGCVGAASACAVRSGDDRCDGRWGHAPGGEEEGSMGPRDGMDVALLHSDGRGGDVRFVF
jgi:hypothetical protein